MKRRSDVKSAYALKFAQHTRWARAEILKLGPEASAETKLGALWLVCDEFMRRLAAAETGYKP